MSDIEIPREVWGNTPVKRIGNDPTGALRKLSDSLRPDGYPESPA